MCAAQARERKLCRLGSVYLSTAAAGDVSRRPDLLICENQVEEGYIFLVTGHGLFAIKKIPSALQAYSIHFLPCECTEDLCLLLPEELELSSSEGERYIWTRNL